MKSIVIALLLPLASAQSYLRSEKACTFHGAIYSSFVNPSYSAAASEFCSAYITPVVTTTTTITPVRSHTVQKLVTTTTTTTHTVTNRRLAPQTLLKVTTAPTQTLAVTDATRTDTATVSTETDVIDVETEYPANIVATSFDATSTETFYTAVETDTVTTIVQGLKKRAAGAMGPSLVSKFGPVKVSSACSCILTAAATSKVVVKTKTAPVIQSTSTQTIVKTKISTTKVVSTIFESFYVRRTSTVKPTITQHTTAVEEEDLTATQTLSRTATSSIATTVKSDILAKTTLPTTILTTTTTTASPISVCTTSTISEPVQTELVKNGNFNDGWFSSTYDPPWVPSTQYTFSQFAQMEAYAQSDTTFWHAAINQEYTNATSIYQDINIDDPSVAYNVDFWYLQHSLVSQPSGPQTSKDCSFVASWGSQELFQSHFTAATGNNAKYTKVGVSVIPGSSPLRLTFEYSCDIGYIGTGVAHFFVDTVSIAPVVAPVAKTSMTTSCTVAKPSS